MTTVVFLFTVSFSYPVTRNVFFVQHVPEALYICVAISCRYHVPGCLSYERYSLDEWLETSSISKKNIW